MAEQLTPEQIQEYKKLLAESKHNEKISEMRKPACAIGGAMVGIAGGIVGNVPGAVLGAIGGCATGIGLVDIYYGVKDFGEQIIDDGKKALNVSDAANIPQNSQQSLPRATKKPLAIS